MRLTIQTPGALTTIQDLGRWGYQAIGMPVSGAMDAPALIRGNILLGNDDNAAALELTMSGATILFGGEDNPPVVPPSLGEKPARPERGNPIGAIAVTGGDLQPKLNGQAVQNWTVIAVHSGDVLTFGGVCGHGFRAYLCVSGGIDVPPVMGSRSTYMKAKIGGLEGRKLLKGDVLNTGNAGSYTASLSTHADGTTWQAGVSCPENLRPDYSNMPLRTVLGPQDSYIKPEGIKTFFEAEYKLSSSSDRMGSRMEGDKVIEHVKGPDIVSDAIPMGAVQIPGQGLPIVMMADRQTTGGYVKIGVVHALDVARLSQYMPGSPVRFTEITQEQGIDISRAEAERLNALRAHVSQPATPHECGAMNVIVDGEKYFVEWEKLS